MSEKIDLTGQRFGRLTVIGFAESRKRKNGSTEIFWNCVCDCGKVTKPIRTRSLRHGAIRSCGCLKRDEVKKRSTKHGLYNSRIYQTWADMKSRCYNSKHKAYRHYGGRGITVCEEWRNDFKAFYDWAIANGYYDDLSIDRIDVNGNYEPSNCRWATAKVQIHNRRPIVVRGETVYPALVSELIRKGITCQMLSEKTGISPSTLSIKLRKGSFTFNEAVRIKASIGTEIPLENLFEEVG